MISYKAASFIRRISHFLYHLAPASKQEERVAPWFKINGDKTLRLNYELNSDSLVIDLGGYEGQWASDIYSKYRCKILIFEPYLPYSQNIKDRFRQNNDITVFDIGLSGNSKEETLHIGGDSSSIFKKGEATAIIKLEQALSFFKRNEIKKVNLMKINIEGGEYDLLEHLISSDMVKSIENIQIQFHDFAPDAYARVKNIQLDLSKTHTTTYSYEFVWENWRIKK